MWDPEQLWGFANILSEFRAINKGYTRQHPKGKLNYTAFRALWIKPGILSEPPSNLIPADVDVNGNNPPSRAFVKTRAGECRALESPSLERPSTRGPSAPLHPA